MNSTRAEITALSLALQTRDIWLVIMETMALFVIFLTGILGNFLLCLAIYKTRALRNVQNYFLVSLAATDISCTVLCMPLTLAVLITGKWPFRDYFCQLQGSLLLILSSVSLLSMAIIALNRYVKMVRSVILYKKAFSKTIVVLWIILFWTGATVVVSCSFHIETRVFNFHPGKCICFQRTDTIEKLREYFFLAYVIMAIIVFPAITFSYLKVYKKVRSHFIQIADSSLYDENSKAFAEEVKISKMLFVTCCAFFVCWSPIICTDIYEEIKEPYRLPREVYFFNTLTAFGSRAVNPIIYGLMRREFSKAYEKVLFCNHA